MAEPEDADIAALRTALQRADPNAKAALIGRWLAYLDETHEVDSVPSLVDNVGKRICDEFRALLPPRGMSPRLSNAIERISVATGVAWEVAAAVPVQQQLALQQAEPQQLAPQIQRTQGAERGLTQCRELAQTEAATWKCGLYTGDTSSSRLLLFDRA